MGEITRYAKILIGELEKRGIKAKTEYNDGHKSVDLFIEEANLIIEVDGSHHSTDPEQALADLKRAKYSLADDRFTYHLSNTLIYNYPSICADLIKDMVYNLKNKKSKESKLNSKVLSSEQYNKIKEELKRELQEELSPKEQTESVYLFPKKPSKKKIVFFIFALVLLFLLALYIILHQSKVNTNNPFSSIMDESNSTILPIKKTLSQTNESTLRIKKPSPKIEEPVSTPEPKSFFQFQDGSRTDDEIKQEIADKLAEYDTTTTNAMNRISVYNLASAWGLSRPGNPSLSGQGCGYTLVINGYGVVVEAIFQADCMGGRNSNGYSVNIIRP